MNRRCLASIGVLAAVIAVFAGVLLAPGRVAGCEGRSTMAKHSRTIGLPFIEPNEVVPERNASGFDLSQKDPARHPRWDHILLIYNRDGKLVESCRMVISS